MDHLGYAIYDLAKLLFPICRSITGNGVRATLKIIQEIIPDLAIKQVPSGSQCFDWTVPKEWNVKDAYILDPEGEKILDFKKSNLHLMGYSIPVDKVISLDELEKHLYSLPEQPEAIPYITSYYQERWGFCLSEKQRRSLVPGNYRVFIDSELVDGFLTYGELILPGAVKEEVFLSTYICHPSLANNELSGPVVTTYLAKWLTSLEKRYYSYRIIFIPETIGSIVYLSQHIKEMQKNIIAGFNITCVGDDRAYSYLPSRAENTLSDKVALHVLRHKHPEFIQYSYLDRGSDERQYCSPGVDLPIATVMRSKYGAYPEYHSSLDNLSLITPDGLLGGYEVLKQCIECIEQNEILTNAVLCEPQLGRRGLYPTLSTKESSMMVYNMMNLIAYCDGQTSVLDIAEKIQLPLWELIPVVNTLKAEGLLTSFRRSCEYLALEA